MIVTHFVGTSNYVYISFVFFRFHMAVVQRVNGNMMRSKALTFAKRRCA